MTRQTARINLRSALFFTAPNVLGFLVFLAGPLIVSLVVAFTNWDLRKTVPLHFVGLRNFVDLWQTQTFWVYLINTLYLMIGIPISVAGSLILALVLNNPLKEKSIVGRFVHCAAVLFVSLIVAGSIHALQTQAASIAAGMILLIACIYVFAIFSGIVVYRTLFYLPSFTSGVALYILWKALYNPQTGPINSMLEWVLNGSWGGLNMVLGWIHLAPLQAPLWLQSINNLFALSPEHPGFDSHLFGIGAREAITIMGVISGVGGGNMLLYLAGLSNVPMELYEAADIDGASRWQKFWAVTWPQLAPTTFFITIMSCIGGLQGGFDVAKVMTDGGPSGTTTTLAFYIYDKAFHEYRFGEASAIAWALFAIVFIITALNWKFGNQSLND